MTEKDFQVIGGHQRSNSTDGISLQLTLGHYMHDAVTTQLTRCFGH